MKIEKIKSSSYALSKNFAREIYRKLNNTRFVSGVQTLLFVRAV